MNDLIENPNLKFSIWPWNGTEHLSVDGNNWSQVLAIKPSSGSWMKVKRPSKANTNGSLMKGSAQISREEALMILFQCKG